MFGIAMKIRRRLQRIRLENRITSEQQREEYLNLNGIPKEMREPLTHDEQCAVKDLWGSINPRISMQEYEVFKSINGFNPCYLTHHTYLPLVARRINNYRHTKFFEHKSLLGYLTNSPVRFPECYVRCIEGELYGEDMRQLDQDEAVTACLPHDSMIYKASEETSGGKSVARIKLAGLTASQREAEIKKALSAGGRNFVIQECIVQHPATAAFNEASVNTLRITSLYLNGRFSILSIVFRFGKSGMHVDNWGAGGIIIGVNKDGTMAPIGYDIKLSRFESYNGVIFAKQVFPGIPDLLRKVEQTHIQAFPLCKFVGWDICLDEAGEPVLLELNSSQPGVFGEQICTGPIFGKRTQEVIDYCKSKAFNY